MQDVNSFTIPNQCQTKNDIYQIILCGQLFLRLGHGLEVLTLWGGPRCDSAKNIDWSACCTAPKLAKVHAQETS